MANVRTTFTSDDKDVQAALARMVRETEKLREANRKLAGESKKHGQEQQTLLQAATDKIGGMIQPQQQLLSIVKAIGQGFKDWRADLKEAAQAGLELSRQLRDDAAGAGRLPEVMATRQFAEGVQGATRAEALAALRGIEGAATGLDGRDARALARRVAPVAGELGFDQQQFAAFAGVMQQAMPKREAAIPDLAVKMFQDMGDRAGQLGTPQFRRTLSRLQEAGVDDLTALAMAVEARDDLRVLSQIATVVGEDRSDVIERHGTRRRGQVLTPQEQAQLRFAQADPAERMRLLMTDAAVRRAELPGAVSADVGRLFDAEGLAERRADLEGAVAGRHARRQRGLARAAFPELMALRGAEQEEDRLMARDERKRLAEEIGERLHRSAMRDMHPVHRGLTQFGEDIPLIGDPLRRTANERMGQEAIDITERGTEVRMQAQRDATNRDIVDRLDHLNRTVDRTSRARAADAAMRQGE